MSKIKNKIRERQSSYTSMKAAFYNEQGAIDLASIMVGIIVIGLIGGVIAATVFAVIPWAQDNAAEHQLDSIHTAQNAYYGLSSDPSRPLAAGQQRNSFTNSAGLAASGLLTTGTTYCTVPTNGGKDYEAFAKSSSGTIFKASNSNKKAFPFIGTLPNDVTTGDCSFLAAGSTGTGSEASYVDPTPTKTILTYRCDASTSGVLPFNTISQGTLTIAGDDGSKIEKAYTNTQYTDSTLLKTGVTYTVTLDGKYSWLYQANSSLAGCVRSLDHWGEQSGVTKAQYGLAGASKLTSVPEHIPSTVTDLSDFFENATIFNDPNVTKWDVSNVTKFVKMFYQAQAFNQPLNDWNMSKAESIVSMFAFSYAFNQPLDKWTTTNVTDMAGVFTYAKVFNQNISSWNVSKVTRMSDMFNNAAKFNQPLDTWDVSNVTTMDSMFRDAMIFNQDIGMWKPAKVTDMEYMFASTSVFRYDLSSWTFNVRPSYFAWAPTGFPTASYPKF